METLELKNLLAQYIDKADDKVLKIVKAVFETYEETNSVSEKDTSKVFDQLIDKGLQDLKAGRTRSHNDVMADVKKRYNIVG
ncbi:hypothetical protein SCB49_06252 [unidentified eubacterium SCB49]|nr:hypothetical protein SCB49_06252 [unidentified eubacterium SCB49]